MRPWTPLFFHRLPRGALFRACGGGSSKIVCPACAFSGARGGTVIYVERRGALRWSYPTTCLWTACEQIINPFRQGGVFSGGQERKQFGKALRKFARVLVLQVVEVVIVAGVSARVEVRLSQRRKSGFDRAPHRMERAVRERLSSKARAAFRRRRSGARNPANRR